MSTNKIATACFCAVLLCSCSAERQNEWFVSHNGNMPSEERIARVEKGDSKDDVLHLLGVPSAVMSFDENTWIYMSSDVRKIAFLKPVELDRDILTIKFNEEGNVSSIMRYSKDEGKDIEISKDATEFDESSRGFFKEYFGGVGAYMPFPTNNKK